METNIKNHSGSKYLRTIYPAIDKDDDGKPFVPTLVDVYSVLEAFAVTSPSVAHAIKKGLCSGIRGKGDRLQDLMEARDALSRAIVSEQQQRAEKTPSLFE